MLTRQQKEEIVNELAEAFRKDPSAFLINYSGVNTKGMQALRSKVREQGGTVRVVKKTLLKRALATAGLESSSDELLSGQVAVTFGYNDPVGTARALFAFRKELETEKGPDISFAVSGGWLSAQPFDATRAQSLSQIPSHRELLSKLVGSIASPLRRFVVACNWPMQSMAYVLKAKVDLSMKHEA